MILPASPSRRLRAGVHVLLVSLSGIVPVAATPVAVRAQQPAAAPADTARWAAVARALGREGEAKEGYYRVSFPRRDLAVRIGNQMLAPGFELTSHLSFIPAQEGRVMAMGELVLREGEVAAVMEEARRQGVEVPALHNHLLGETPRVLYVHLATSGEPGAVGRKLRVLLARTATPAGPGEAEERGDAAAWAAVSAALGAPEEVGRETAEWVFPRRERITEGGHAVRSTGMLETASEVVFQRLGGARAATGGELFLAADEVTPVTQALEAGGIHVTAIHHHMLHETPRLYWLHWYGVGDASALGRTIRDALGHTNSVLPEGTAGRRGGEGRPAPTAMRSRPPH